MPARNHRLAQSLARCTGTLAREFDFKIDRRRSPPYRTYVGQRDSADAVSARPRAVEDDVDKLLLTPHEAAQVLGIGRSKLCQLMRAGTVASVRIGRCRRIPASSLPGLIAQLQTDAFDGVRR